MARIYTSIDGQIDELAREVTEEFDSLSKRIQDRKNELLFQLDSLRLREKETEIDRKQTISVLNGVEENLESIKLNKLNDLSNELRAKVGEKKEFYEKELLHIKFLFNREMHKSIANLGEIVEEWLPKYSQQVHNCASMEKVKCSVSIEKPTGVCVNEESQLIYIVESGKCRIKVFTMDCEFLREFGENKLKGPVRIAVNKNNLFITDHKLQTVLKYNVTSHPEYIKSICEREQVRLEMPHGVDVDPVTEEVYVTDTKHSTVLIYSSDLVFKRNLGHNLVHPLDVRISQNCILVLDNGSKGSDRKPNMYKFNRSGNLIIAFHLLGGSIEVPQHFSTDCMGNLLISNWRNDTVAIAHPDGVVYCSIGSDAKSGTVLKTPKGLAVTRSGRVVVVSETPKRGLQIWEFVKHD